MRVVLTLNIPPWSKGISWYLYLFPGISQSRGLVSCPEFHGFVHCLQSTWCGLSVFDKPCVLGLPLENISIASLYEAYIWWIYKHSRWFNSHQHVMINKPLVSPCNMGVKFVNWFDNFPFFPREGLISWNQKHHLSSLYYTLSEWVVERGYVSPVCKPCLIGCFEISHLHADMIKQ